MVLATSAASLLTIFLMFGQRTSAFSPSGRKRRRISLGATTPAAGWVIMGSVVAVCLLAAPSTGGFFLQRTRTVPHPLSSSQQITSDSVVTPSSDRSGKSRILSIQSQNLAGVVNEQNSEDSSIRIEFDDDSFCAITGETGSGKSLLFVKVIELLSGAKATSNYLLHEDLPVSVELEVLLDDRYLQASQSAFESLCVSVSGRRLHLSRTIMMEQGRLKSVCQINGETVTIKVLSKLCSSLLAVVDASAASTALSRPQARLAILDTTVSPDLVETVRQSREAYRVARTERESLQEELASRTLPSSFSPEDDTKLVEHWIDELGIFSKRVETFSQQVTSFETEFGVPSDLNELAETLAAARWEQNSAPKGSNLFASTLYEGLVNFRDALKSLDEQIVAARNAIDALSLLSSNQSAATAIERARTFLFESSSTGGSHLEAASEKAHDLLNDVDNSLAICTRWLEDDENGILRTLEKERSKVPISVEKVDEIILDWNSLARKHGIQPLTLPSCHKALESEFLGNVEAKQLLPKAIEAEDAALEVFQEHCKALTEERETVASLLATSVTDRLPSLGLDDAEFQAIVSASRSCDDPSAFSSSAPIGLDTVDFLLIRKNEQAGDKGGKVDEVASSGEKARLLLAIECALPGSVGAACSGTPVGENMFGSFPPVAVVYDEIDAHVGGRAAVALANMLSSQSESSQVIAITHSPSVAAFADMHVVVQKYRQQANGTTPVRVVRLQDDERRTELARMASGDVAAEEALAFADALIRDGRQHATA